jgi:rhodanese-related sulfurtransferase
MLIQSSCDKKIISVIKKLKKQNTKKMKQFKKIIFLMAILPFLFIASCKDDDPAPVNPIEETTFTVLADYLVENNLDMDDVVSGWITARPTNEDGSAKTETEIDAWTAGFDIFDIRQAVHYDEGHIKNAVNSSLGAIVADAANTTKPILVVCYSGQSAAHAVVALRLSGYPDTKTLKWGMSGWTRENECDKWTGATKSEAIASGNWVSDVTVQPSTYDYPTLTSTSTDGATILAERVAAMTAKGFQGIASSDVYGTPANYHINNFWTQGDVDTYGIISGAYLVNPLTLANGEIKAYDPDATNVTYCWTGQTSSMVTAYLTVLGYEATSLKNGVNSMIYDDLQTHKWTTLTFDYHVQSN